MSDDRLPLVSVVVPARNAEAEIRTCLTSLQHLEYPLRRHEVVVVDNGSADATAQIAVRYPFRYVREARRGVGHARNAGLEASRGELIAFTDTDCAVSTGWLRELVEPFGGPAVGGVGGAIVPYPPETSAQRYAARRMSHSQLRPMSHPARPFAMTPNVAFRRDALLRVGGFDTRFPGGGWEDADLCWRLTRETELEFRYAPRAVVFHRYRATAREFLVQHYSYGYGLGLLHRKYGDELRRGWRQRGRDYAELAGTAWGCARAAKAAVVATKEGGEPDDRWFDFLRALGQRTGFLSGSLAFRALPWRPRPAQPSR
jgi:glycosyltransferase involved in cell wall biosynthesis